MSAVTNDDEYCFNLYTIFSFYKYSITSSKFHSLQICILFLCITVASFVKQLFLFIESYIEEKLCIRLRKFFIHRMLNWLSSMNFYFCSSLLSGYISEFHRDVFFVESVFR